MLTLAEVLEDFKKYSKISDEIEINAHSRNSAGETPLHFMATIGDQAAIELLARAGAEVNAKDNNGNTPLHHAVLRIQKTAISALMEHGADPHLSNNAGLTPMNMTEHANLEWMRPLLIRGAQPAVYDRELKFGFRDALASADCARDVVAYLDDQFSKGSGKAGYLLFLLIGDELIAGEEEALLELSKSRRDPVDLLVRSFPLLHEEAFCGDGEAMHFLAHYYQSALPPLGRSSEEMFKFWVRKARNTEYGRNVLQF